MGPGPSSIQAERSGAKGPYLDPHRIALGVQFDLGIFPGSGPLGTTFRPGNPTLAHPKARDVVLLNPPRHGPHAGLHNSSFMSPPL